jgi:hypothetical protein
LFREKYTSNTLEKRKVASGWQMENPRHGKKNECRYQAVLLFLFHVII